MAVKLIAKSGFHAYGKTYNAGDEVDPKDASKWPENAMATRLNNGWMEYREVSEDAPVAGETNYERIQRASNAGELGDKALSEDQAGPAAEQKSIGRMSADDLKAFAQANDLTVDVDALDGIGAKRKAVAEAYNAKQAAGPVGGVAGAKVDPNAPAA